MLRDGTSVPDLERAKLTARKLKGRGRNPFAPVVSIAKRLGLEVLEASMTEDLQGLISFDKGAL